MNTTKNYLIGLDVSIQDGNNGLAIYDVRGKDYVCVRSMNEDSLVGEILEFLAMHGIKSADGRVWENVAVIVENAELDSLVFGAWESYQKKIQAAMRSHYPNFKSLGEEFRVMMTKAQNVGMQKAVARLVIKRLRAAGLEVLEVAPSWRERADSLKTKGGLAVANVAYYKMPTKTTAAQFKQLTGYGESTSEHGRDAATLLWNQTYEGLKLWINNKNLLLTGVVKKKRDAKALKQNTIPKKKPPTKTKGG